MSRATLGRHGIEVSGAPDLLARMAAALVREVADVELTLATIPVIPDLDGVLVRNTETDRWLYLSAGPGPGRDLAHALSAGASAVLTLSSSISDWSNGVNNLLGDGQVFVSPEVLQWMANETLNTRSGLPSEARLTAREREVLSLVATGASTAEIAASLGIAINTVRTHLHALSVKLESTSRTKMLATARALSLVDDDSPLRMASA